MKSVINRQSGCTRWLARAAIIALCLGAAPMALAHNSGNSGCQGGNYLANQCGGSHDGHGPHGDHQSGGGVGSYHNSTPVPEPATWGMFGLGLAMIGMGVASRRRRERTTTKN